MIDSHSMKQGSVMGRTRPWGQMTVLKSQWDHIMRGHGQVTWNQPNEEQLPQREKKKELNLLTLHDFSCIIKIKCR